MSLTTVPDFFQEDTEEALHEQVEWLHREIGLDDTFFVRLLRIDPATFANWKSSHAPLPPEHEETLHTFWRMMMRLYSSLYCEEWRIRDLFPAFVPARPEATSSPYLPPWHGSTLREFLESGGNQAIGQVDYWAEGFHAGDPFIN